MRVVAFAGILFACTALTAHLPPLTVKDVALMLRTGYSTETVQHELATRHLLGSIGAAEELALTRANAAPVLIDAMKSGAFAVPKEEVATAQSQLAADAARRATEAQRSREMDTLYQAQIARQRAAAAATKNGIAAGLQNDLVTVKDGASQPFISDTLPNKKLIGLYFSAHWCGPCRKFTPQLVDFYNRVAPQHPEFEIVFVSADHSRAEMETYVREAKMPWPALDYDKVKGRGDINKFAGAGIPCLVVIDAEGHVVSDSYAGTEYRGPAKVLEELDELFANPAGARVAQSR
ncbi:MAG: thioredoxin-like domain-containing protein [Chthoniobacterales bacterium]